MDENYNVKRMITMFCGSNMFNSIDSTNTVTAVKGIPLDNPIKYVYDVQTRIYFMVLRNNGWMDDKIGDNDVVIVNSSQFGDEGVKQEDILAAIARITNFAKNPAEVIPPVKS